MMSQLSRRHFLTSLVCAPLTPLAFGLGAEKHWHHIDGDWDAEMNDRDEK